MSILSTQLKEKKENENYIDQLPYEKIKVSEIQRNHENFFVLDKEDIEILAEDIKANQLNHPIQVRVLPKDHPHYLESKPYEIIDGERRFKAHQIAGLEYIDVKVVHGISDEDSIERMVSANLTNRVITTSEYLQSVEILKQQYTAKKRDEGIPGRIRTLIARAMKISESQVGRYETVLKKAIPDVLEYLKENKIGLKYAVKIVSLDPDEQQYFVDNYDIENESELIRYQQDFDSLLNEDIEPIPLENDELFEDVEYIEDIDKPDESTYDDAGNDESVSSTDIDESPNGSDHIKDSTLHNVIKQVETLMQLLESIIKENDMDQIIQEEILLQLYIRTKGFETFKDLVEKHFK